MKVLPVSLKGFLKIIVKNGNIYPEIHLPQNR